MIDSVRQEKVGVVAAIRWRGERHELRAPLYGLHHGRNIALALKAAWSLGLSPEDIVASLRSAPQIAHRLEVKRQPNGTVLIDDAYNSNPVGFASALELLDVLRQPDGRRIVVTPGMVELGAEHEAEHARIGKLAAEHAEVLVAVRRTGSRRCQPPFARPPPSARSSPAPGLPRRVLARPQPHRPRCRAARKRPARPARTEAPAMIWLL